MSIRRTTLWQRSLSLLLCVAMLVSFLPATAWAVDGADDAVELLSADEATVVQVSSPAIEFVPATEPLKQEGRYLLMSDAYGHIMSFDATAAPEVASGEQHGTSYTGSIMLDTDGDSANTYYMDGDNVILDNSDRHFAIWNLRQYKEATGGTTKLNGNLMAASGNTTFGGSAQYAGIELQKRTNYHDSYWYSHYFDESAVAGSDFQLRFFCFKSDSTAFKNHYRNSLQTTNNDVYGNQTDSRVKFILDSLGDETYLLYFKESNTDYRVVTCDENGRWDVIRYQGSNAVSSMKADMDKLKIRLYEYTETEGHKSVAFSGQLKYQVDKNTAVEAILTQISSGITVFDPTCRNQHIPYNGSEVNVTNIGGTQYDVGTKAGYYWLDAEAVKTSVAGEYPVLIKYRNDDGTDTTVGQVSVIVGSGYAVIEGSTKHGTVMKNAGVSAVVNVVSGEESAPATFALNGETIKITVGMLTDAEGKRLDTSVPGEYTGLTLTYKGMTICEDFTLTVASSDHALDYPEYPEPGSVEVYKGSTTTEADFAGTGVANIELSATAQPVEKGVDLIFIVDLSGSMRYHVNNSQYACGPKYLPSGELNPKVPTDYNTQAEQLQYVYQEGWWQYTRLAAMENALADMVNTLADAKADVQIAIADFGDLDHYEFEDAKLDDTIGLPLGSKPYWDADLNDTGMLNYEFSNHVNFIQGRDDPSYKDADEEGAFMSQPYWIDQTKHNEDYFHKTHLYTYTGKLKSKIFTGDGSLSSGAFMDVSALQPKLEDLKEDLKKQNGKRLGTNYDVGLETAYRLAYAREQYNIASGEERDIVCIFMSDGAAMQFNYLSGRSQTEAWSQAIIGETDEILDQQNVADKYVITSDPYDTSVNQNPNLQAMLKDLLKVLEEGNLIIPTKSDVKSTYPKWDKNNYNGTDFFLAMKSIGVDCDWELLWQIAYELYDHHGAAKTHGLTFPDGSTLYGGPTVLDKVVMSMRTPSYDAAGNQYQYQTLTPYYYFYNAEGKNWWAEAIKGDADKLYPVISKFAFKDSTEWGEDTDFYYGDVRNNFIGETTKTYDKYGNETGTLALEGKDYIAGFKGLDLDLYTIGFSLGTENQIAYEETAQVLENIASGPAYHFEAASGETLIEVLKSITSTISTSATRSYFTDQMGDDYDLSTEKTVVDKDGNTVTVNASPTIRVLEYALDKDKPVYAADGSVIRYERGEASVRETITFEGGMVAKSDQVYTIVTDASGNQVKQYPDIWDDDTGLITGKYVIYNTNKYVDENNDGSVDLTLDDSGLVFELTAETFFWTIGMLGETEMVLEYQVYLSGSLEGKLSPYTTYYDTNEDATLRYKNYLDNDCAISVDPPKFPWGDIPQDYPPYPQDGSVKPDKVGTTTEEEFLQTGVANIQLSATGIPMEQGVDLIVVMDLSGSMEKGVDSNKTAEKDEQSRIDAMEDALKNMVKILRDSGKDIRIAMTDFGDLDSHEFESAVIDESNADHPFFDVNFDNGLKRPNFDDDGNLTAASYEFSNYLNFPMKTGDQEAAAYTIANSKFNLSNPSYTGKVTPTVYTGGHQVNAGAFVNVSDLNDKAMAEIIAQLNVNVQKSYGTNYDQGLEYAYQLGYAIRQQNQTKGEDRKQVCIFLSDGAAMQYNYFSGRTVSTTWADWLTGDADGITSMSQNAVKNSDAMKDLEAALLELLKDGKLVRPDYQRDSDNDSKIKEDGVTAYYYRFDPDTKARGDSLGGYFYTYMDDNGNDLDWDYLCQIAEFNGLTGYDYSDFLADKRVTALKELYVVDASTAKKTVYVKDADGNDTEEVDYYVSKLKNPTYVTEQYYAKCAAAETDFFTALKNSNGIDQSWDLFAKIAFTNRNNASTSLLTLLRKVIEDIHNTDGNGAYQTLSPYAYFYNAEGKNWWAEAIKGDTDKLYPVINKYAKGVESPFGYNGEENKENNFSGATTAGLALDGKDYISGFQGLGMDLYTISFSMAPENEISAETAETVLKNIATGPSYFFSANSTGALDSAMKAIVSTMSHTATRAWFVDTMGDDYDLSTEKTVVNENGETITVNADPHISVMEFDLDENGKRTGDPNVRETIHFNSAPEGSTTVLKAWSDQVYTTSVVDNQIVVTYTDIWDQESGLITGKYVIYNTNKYVDEDNTGTVPLTLDASGLKYPLPAETFFWTIGMLGETEMVLEYQAYLTGSVEGTLRTNGVKKYFDTNESATLNYINYLGNPCSQSVPSPRYPWKTDSNSGLVTDKYVEATENDPNAFTLTLEAYAKGSVRDVKITKPADIVLVLDHSGSMRTPVGATEVLKSGTLYEGPGEIERNLISTEKGSHRGYYVAQSVATKSWFIMEFVEDYPLDNGTTVPRWVGYLVPSTEAIVDTTYGNYTEHTKILTWVPGSVDANLVFYKSQYAVLYDALLEFVSKLRESGAEHNVSIIGFAGSQGNGSRLYAGSSEGVKTYNGLHHANTDDARRNELYQLSMKNVQDDAEYADLLRNIELIETNHSFTCPTAGLVMAGEDFAANEADLEQRDRIVVLFTDGIPNRKLGEEEITDAEANRTGRQTEIYDEIVRQAWQVKNTYGAQIYSICTTTLAAGTNGENRTFLNYTSSNYPDAANYSYPGIKASDKYFHTINSFDTLSNVFSTITNSTVKATTELDETAVLKELLTDYFVLDPKAEYQVKAYTAPYKGTGSFDDPTSFGSMTELPDGSVTLSSSDNSDRMDVISVTGYDYKDEYLSGVERTVNGQSYYGSKLVVKVKVRARDGFWGGNNVPTNKNDTAIWTPDSTDASGDPVPGIPVEYFPRPEVNVPIDVTVAAQDKTIYYGGELDSDEDSFTGDELLTGITAGGKPVTVVTTTNPDGSTTTTFVPEASWMDDFADMEWTDDSTTITDELNNVKPDDYTYGVTVTPKYDGEGNKQSENPGNLAGNVDGGAVETDPPKAAGSDTAKDTGHIYILVPEVTFKDSVTEFGTPFDGYDYPGKDVVEPGITWVFMEDKTDPSAAPDPDEDTRPTLTLTYQPVSDENLFLEDTRVEVNITSSNPDGDISSVTRFDWDDGCSHDIHKGENGEIIDGHYANASGQHEFWVHVKINILPDTVVIDFGLPVDIDPLVNDMHGVANVTKELVGIGDDFQTGKSFTYGDAAVREDKQLVRYSLHTSNGMQMNKEETFKYRGSYAINGKAMTAESTITVIPATIIYYEDSFVTYTGHGTAWSAEGTLNSIQDTDRPGAKQIGTDLDNIYGYDSHYVAENGYSMGTWHQITVSGSNYGEAAFTFTGTAFDVIALSSGTTGTITVSVYEGTNTTTADPICNYMVDTYYGYRFEDGKWIITDPTDPSALYQVPVMKVDMTHVRTYDRDTKQYVYVDHGYGTYTAVITVAYDFMFDHDQYTGGGKYDFMLDAIRIYDQANDGATSAVVKDAYLADGEGWPEYTELRDILIAADTFNSLGQNDEVSGIVFIDGIPELKNDTASGTGSDVTDNVTGKSAAIVDYANFGPNNELYLAPGQGVAFQLNTPAAVQNVHLALKSVGGTANVKVYDAEAKDVNVLNGSSEAFAVDTATDLYYSISGLKNKTVIIRNVSGAILSVTNIKMTYSTDPKTAGLNQQDMFRVSYEVASAALAALKPEPVNPFVDIFEGDYYYDPILWALENGITNGVDATHFGPAAVCNRAQVVTFLWRAAGCPEPNVSKHPFVDVEADSFYYKAMLWAVENGITNGVDATHFAPNGQCNRAQVVTFLWRAKGCPEPELTEHAFTDVEDGSFYHKATLWAVENGITNGMSANSFAPTLTCTRGQVVTFLYRASEK